jgi:glutamate synthase (NADPH/NADH) large chain/glutamate synthase (ferredoxin)
MPEMLIRYLDAVAEEVRSILAELGFRSLNEIVGRTDLLKQRSITDHAKANTVDLSRILARRDYERDQRLRVWYRNDKPDKPLDDTILQDVKDALREKTALVRSYRIRNIHRSIGTKLSGEIAYLYGDLGLPPNTIELRFAGSAGQSFGAFLVRGVRLILTGEANDYVGKGMCGGEIVVMPTRQRLNSTYDVVVGNTVLYGATGGTLYACGRAGERFAVRNSGALAVVEGVGDHGCEYMTNGTVVVLGTVGRNFGAGMTGGKAYVLDFLGDFSRRCNTEFVRFDRLDGREDTRVLQSIIYQYVEATSSERAQKILLNWSEYQSMFWKIAPKVQSLPLSAQETPMEASVDVRS